MDQTTYAYNKVSQTLYNGHSLSPLQVLVELVHFARKSLSPEQLERCIHLLTSISSSSGLPQSVHIMCVRVILGLTGGCRLCDVSVLCVCMCVCVHMCVRVVLGLTGKVLVV
jgi:hypothetical protein